MDKLFGIDIKGIVTGAMRGNLKPVVLSRVEQAGEYNAETDRYEYSNGTEALPIKKTYESEGIVEDYSDRLIAEGVVTDKERQILVLAEPLFVRPVVGDKVEIEGHTYTVVGVPKRDPAGATWTIRGQI